MCFWENFGEISQSFAAPVPTSLKFVIGILSMTVLTGREYSRMARKRITMMRMMSPIKRHLNLRHTMNFMVLHGLVNQKKEVSGRLTVERIKVCVLHDTALVLN